MSGIVVSDALRTSITSSDTLRLLAYLGAAEVSGPASSFEPGAEEWFQDLLRWGPALPVWVAVHATRVAAERESLSLAADQLALEALESAHLFALLPDESSARKALEAAEKIPERFNPSKRACLRLACRSAALAAGQSAEDDSAPNAVAEAAWRSFSFAQSTTDSAAGEFEQVMAEHLIREVLQGREPVF